jgi:hypothetical protein
MPAAACRTELACCQGVDGGYYHHEPDRILDWVSSPNKVGNCDWTFLRTGTIAQDNNVKRIATVIGNWWVLAPSAESKVPCCCMCTSPCEV